jgi:predicted phosphodiesterase
VRIGIFSDVHGNSEALEIVLKSLKYERVDRTICLGDLVGYGPEPNQCVDRVMNVADKVVVGNHDHAATGQLSTEHFNEYARRAIDWTREILSPASVNILKRLPLILTEGDITWVHATPEAPSEWYYILTYTDAHRSFQVLKGSLCFIGHSHVPVVFTKKEEKISLEDATDVIIEPDKKYIINVGSVGQPRDGDPRASYGILDTDEPRFQLKRLPYPVDVVQEKMKKENLPPYLISRLSVGL